MLVLREAFARDEPVRRGSRRKLEIGRTLLSERLNRLVEEEIFDRVRYSEQARALRVQAHAQGARPVPGAAGADGVGRPLQGRRPAGAAVPQGVRRGGRPAPGVQPLRRAGGLRRPARRVRARTHGSPRRRHGRRRLHRHLDRGQRRDRRRADRLRRAATRRGERDDRRRAARSSCPGYIEPHTHPWCLYSPASLLEVAVPDGTTTLVYDNLFFYLAHGVDGLRSIVDQMNAAPAHVKWVARISPQSALRTRRRVRDRARRAAARVAGGRRAAARSRTGCRRRRGEPRVAAGIAAAKAARQRVEGHNAGASYNRLNEL